MTHRHSAGHAAAVRIAALVGVVLLAPAGTWAQEPVKTFDQLDMRLKVGDTIWVTDAQGREIRGRSGNSGRPGSRSTTAEGRRLRPRMCGRFGNAGTTA